MPPKPTPKSVKGKPLGIPKWGWIIAAVLGILIGVMLLKKSASAATGSVSSPDSANPTGAGSGSDGGSGGGTTVIQADDLLKALGLIGGTQTGAPTTTTSPSAPSNSSPDTFAAQSQPTGFYPDGTTFYDPVPPGGTVGVPQTYTDPTTGEKIFYNPGDYVDYSAPVTGAYGAPSIISTAPSTVPAPMQSLMMAGISTPTQSLSSDPSPLSAKTAAAMGRKMEVPV